MRGRGRGRGREKGNSNVHATVYSGTPQCRPPEKRTPRLSGRFVAVPNDLPYRSAPLRYGHLDNPECGHCAVHALYSTIVKSTH